VCVSAFFGPGLVFLELFVSGPGYSAFLEGEIGDAADEGGVLTDRFERDVSLSDDRDEDIERLF
jgi:hypothetical protein